MNVLLSSLFHSLPLLISLDIYLSLSLEHYQGAGIAAVLDISIVRADLGEALLYPLHENSLMPTSLPNIPRHAADFPCPKKLEGKPNIESLRATDARWG